MKIRGQLTICDRCGENIFSKLLSSEELDGGWSSYNKFEPLPDGWGSESVNREFLTLCPKCRSEWINLEASIVNKFLNKQE